MIATDAMPIYEYRCADCGEHFEYQQRMSDDPKSECEACSGKLERLISATAFHLKGGGWYKDLYSSTKPESKGGEGNKAGSDSASSGDAAGGASKESKSTDSSSGSSGSGGTKSSGGSE